MGGRTAKDLPSHLGAPNFPVTKPLKEFAIL